MSDKEERKLTREGLEAGKELRGLVLFGFDQSGFERSTDGEPDAITLCCDVDQLLASDWLAKRDRKMRAEGMRAAAGFMAQKSDEAKHFANSDDIKRAGREFLARLGDKYGDQAHELVTIADRVEAGE